MIDFATVPLEVWADYLEEQGHDVSELRAWVGLGCSAPANRDLWLVHRRLGVPDIGDTRNGVFADEYSPWRFARPIEDAEGEGFYHLRGDLNESY